MNKSVTIPSWLWDAIDDRTKDRVHVVTGGLGSGKTTGACIWKLQRAIDNAACRLSWMVAPTYGKANDILLPSFQDIARDYYGLAQGYDYKIVKDKPIRIEFRHLPQVGDTGHQIHIHSGSRADLMVGTNISDYYITEAAFMKREAFEKCQNRARDPKAASIQGLLECTAEWVDWFVELANFEGINEARNMRRFICHTLNNRFIDSKAYCEKIDNTYGYDPVRALCYKDGRFRPFVHGTAYWEFVPSRNIPLVSEGVKPSPYLPIVMSWDFGVSPLPWVAIQKQPHEKRGRQYRRIVVVDEGSGDARGVLDGCAEFVRAFPPDKFGGTRIEIDGGHDGYHGSHLTPTCAFSQIRDCLKRYYSNVAIVASKSAPQVEESLNRTNALFAYELCVVLSGCKNTIRGLEQSSLKPGTWDFEKPTGKDTAGRSKDPTHFPDALRAALFRMTDGLDIVNPDKEKVLGFSIPI
jgi:hypothetical protein